MVFRKMRFASFIGVVIFTIIYEQYYAYAIIIIVRPVYKMPE